MTYGLDEIGATEPDDRPGPGRLRAALVLLASLVAAVLVGTVAVLALRDRSDRPPAAQVPPPPPAVVELPTAAPATLGPTSAPAATATATPPPRRTTPPAPHTPGAPKPPAPPPPVPPPPPPAPPGGCTGCEMPGDGTTPVGGSNPHAVRVGTYHSDGPSGAGSCSWWLARDPAGEDQIAGKTVDHATDVIVKDRTYFHSENCRIWRLRPVNPDFG